MKLHNPIYLPFALVITILVALANHNGWSLVQSVAAGAARHLVSSTQHK
jgi:hypothetical protein